MCEVKAASLSELGALKPLRYQFDAIMPGKFHIIHGHLIQHCFFFFACLLSIIPGTMSSVTADTARHNAS